MQSLISKITGAEHRSIETAKLRYAELLFQGNEDAATEREIQELMVKLGKNAADLAADHALVTQMKGLLATIDKGCGLGDARQAAQKKLFAHNDETKRVLEERQKQHFAITQEISRLGDAHSAADRGQHEVNRLRKDRPDLFAAVRAPQLT